MPAKKSTKTAAIKDLVAPNVATLKKYDKCQMGRPSKYNKDFCKVLVGMYSEGADASEFCSEIGISLSTFYKWKEDYSEFKQAFELADTRALSFYLKHFKNQGLSKDKFPNSNQLFTYVRQRWPHQFGKDAATAGTTNITFNSIGDKSFIELKEEFARLTKDINIIDVEPEDH